MSLGAEEVNADLLIGSPKTLLLDKIKAINPNLVIMGKGTKPKPYLGSLTQQIILHANTSVLIEF
mgnify:CR=1 FL=1